MDGPMLNLNKVCTGTTIYIWILYQNIVDYNYTTAWIVFINVQSGNSEQWLIIFTSDANDDDKDNNDDNNNDDDKIR